MTDQPEQTKRQVEAAPPVRICADLDDECPEVKCKMTCYLYQPERGICPFIAGGRN